jgi:hypothetical protein
MASEFTVFQGVDVLARESGRVRNQVLGPHVRVSFPDAKWDRTDFFRPYATVEEARAAGHALATALKALRPRSVAGFLAARLAAKDPAQVKAREAVEAAVREWATPETTILAVS